jgi:hypothetical protein
VTVDDTGARHAHNNFYTTQIGGEHFSVFRTTKSKSRLNFLSLLRGNYQDYVLDDSAFDYLIPKLDEGDSRDSIFRQIMIQHGERRFRHGNSADHSWRLYG